jgi:hypothetical protein
MPDTPVKRSSILRLPLLARILAVADSFVLVPWMHDEFAARARDGEPGKD